MCLLLVLQSYQAPLLPPPPLLPPDSDKHTLWTLLISLMKPYLQPYAGLLPPRVLAPGQAMGTVTEHMAQLTGLPKGCVVCAGTSGEAAFFLFIVFLSSFLLYFYIR